MGWWIRLGTYTGHQFNLVLLKGITKSPGLRLITINVVVSGLCRLSRDQGYRVMERGQVGPLVFTIYFVHPDDVSGYIYSLSAKM